MKKAFTLLEMVFVIVIIGIIATTVLSRTNSNSLREAALQVLSDIRYTQHLAMVDDKFDPTDNNWYKNRWQFLYSISNSSSRDTGGYYSYTIFSDSFSTSGGKPDFNDIDDTEIAKDPLNREKVLSGGYSGTIDWENEHANKKLNIGYSYNIDRISYSGCGAQRIAFDYLGRPFGGDSSGWTSSLDGILTQQCIFTLHSGSDSIDIFIEPETGYIHL